MNIDEMQAGGKMDALIAKGLKKAPNQPKPFAALSRYSLRIQDKEFVPTPLSDVLRE